MDREKRESIFLKSSTNKMPWRSTPRTSSPREASSNKTMDEEPLYKLSTMAINSNNITIKELENSDSLRKY